VTIQNTLLHFLILGLELTKTEIFKSYLNPQQEESGWNALRSGKLDQIFNNALKNNVSLSLMVASGNIDSINGLISDPVTHAKNLVSDLNPLIDKYKFSDINLDIEYTQNASSFARDNFTKFVTEVRKELKNNETLTVEISPTTLYITI
jgi:spore germination protein YaaH